MSALVAGLALATALSRHGAPSALASQPIVCAANADVSDSGCGNTGFGNSGSGNVGNGNSGFKNVGNGNSGAGNVGNGNSGCSNNGTANSGASNTGVALSGGTACHPVTPVTTPGTTPVTVPGSKTTIPTASSAVAVQGATLPLTGRDSTAPITVALGLLVTGGAVAGLANRRRHVLAASTGGEVMPLSDAVGLLLTGRGKTQVR